MTKPFTVSIQVTDKVGRKEKTIEKNLGIKSTEELISEIEHEYHEMIGKERIRNIVEPDRETRIKAYEVLHFDGPTKIAASIDLDEVNQKLYEIGYEPEKHDIIFKTLNKKADYLFHDIVEVLEEKKYKVYKPKTKNYNTIKENLSKNNCFMDEKSGIIVCIL